MEELLLCDICGCTFANRRQFGPHRRRCLSKGGTFVPQKSSEESFSEDETSALDEDIITEPVLDVLAQGPTPLHVLAQRPAGPWGQARPVHLDLQEDRLAFDFCVDFEEVR